MLDGIYLPKFPSRYQIERQLGDGAIGEVYLATDIERNAKVVIKTLKLHLAFCPQNGQTNVRRFQNEFNALKNCVHPNIIRVFDFCEYDKVLFFTMEYLEGATLNTVIPARPEEEDEDDYLRETCPETTSSVPDTIIAPTLNECIDYLFQIAQALLCVHERGMIHRDLKPENVFLTKDKKIKLLDFGLARPEQSSLRVTIANNALGTPYYMAPEAVTNKPLDHLADIYSFGVLAYELLTKELPYQDKSQVNLSFKHALAKIPSSREKNPEIPDWLDVLIATCMQKDKSWRYQSMAEIIALFHKNEPSLLLVDAVQGQKIAQPPNKKALERHKQHIRAAKQAVLIDSFKRIAIVFCLTMVFLVAWFSPIGTYSNIVLLRTLFAIRGPIEPPKDVVIVALDDLTYQYFGVSTRKPFPRKYRAQALEKINATKPKLVVFDSYIQKENDDEEGNSALEAAIAAGPTVLMKWEEENKSLAEEARDKSNLVEFHSDSRFSKVAFLEVAPFFLVEHGAVTRISSSDDPNESLNDRLPMHYALSRAGLTDLAEPTENDYINFYGKPNRISSISMYKVVSENYDFKDKLVFLGTKSQGRSNVPGTLDLFNTSGSFFDTYFGVEIHATIASNIIDHTYIRRLPPIIEILFLLISIGYLLTFLLNQKPLNALLYLFGILGIWFVATLWAFTQYKTLLPGVFLMLFGSVFACAAVWCVYGLKKDASLGQIQKMTGLDLQEGKK